MIRTRPSFLTSTAFTAPFAAALVMLALPGATMAQDDSASEDTRETTQEARGDNLSRTEDALEKILQDAMDEGIVSIRQDSTGQDSTSQEDTQVQESEEPAAASGGPAPEGYRDITSILTDSVYTPEDETRPIVQPVGSIGCVDDTLFAFLERSYSWDDVTALRSAVAGGAAKPGVDDSIRLAKYYLALGFAEEAMAIVKPFSDDRRAQTVIYMAEVVTGRVGDTNFLKMPESVCSQRVAMWRAVALAEVQPETALFLASSAIGSLAQLPDHLRTDFSTRLGILAVENERWGLAETLYELAMKTSQPEPSSLIYLRALINAYNDVDRGIAINTIERFAQKEGPLQVRAILMLSALQPGEEGEYYPGYYRDLENVTVRRNGAPQSFPEAFMEVRLAAETGDYVKAIRIAAEYQYPTLADQKTMKNTLAGLFETGLSRTSTSTRFAALNGYLGYRSFFNGADHEASLRLGAGRAALDLGLPGVAIELLAAGTKAVDADATLTRLLAEAYLEDGRYPQALAMSRDKDDLYLTTIAASALHRMGREAEALDVLRGLPATPARYRDQASIAWAGGQWSEARDAYAALMVADNDRHLSAFHALASYMSGQRGEFEPLPARINYEVLERILGTHTEEMQILKEVLADG